MPLLSYPYTFTNGTIADANQVDANFNAALAVVNGLDNANVAAGGFYASQIKPTTSVQATFGGALGYIFNPNAAAQVPVTIKAPSGQTADLLDVIVNAVNIMALTAGGMLTFSQSGDGIQLAAPGGVLQLGATAGYGITSTAATTWELLEGAFFNGSAWVSAQANATLVQFNNSPTAAISLFANTGLVPPATFTPTRILNFNSTGISLQGGIGMYGAPANTSFGFSSQGPVLFNGCHFNGTSFVADATTAGTLAMGLSNQLFISYDKGLTPGSTFVPTAQIETQLFGSGSGVMGLIMINGGPISPGNTTTNGSNLWSGSGAASGTLGSNGDFYFRQDNVGGTTNIYKKIAGTWTAIA